MQYGYIYMVANVFVPNHARLQETYYYPRVKTLTVGLRKLTVKWICFVVTLKTAVQ